MAYKKYNHQTFSVSLPNMTALELRNGKCTDFLRSILLLAECLKNGLLSRFIVRNTRLKKLSNTIVEQSVTAPGKSAISSHPGIITAAPRPICCQCRINRIFHSRQYISS